MLSGKQGSGKTSVQKALQIAFQQRKNGRAIQVNFADVLYEMHDKVLQTLHQYVPDRGLAKDGPLLQLLGTEWGRNTLGENIWVEILQKKIEQLATQNSHYDNLLFIIGDCRFMNEFQTFESALRVRLSCPVEIRRERCSMWREGNHISENNLDDVATAGEFDLKLNTDVTSINGCVDLILAQLDKNCWMEKR